MGWFNQMLPDFRSPQPRHRDTVSLEEMQKSAADARNKNRSALTFGILVWRFLIGAGGGVVVISFTLVEL